METSVVDAEAISPEDLEPRRIELDRNLGTDPYHVHERFVVLKDTAKHANMLLTITEPCSNREFPRGNRKASILSKSVYFFMVL